MTERHIREIPKLTSLEGVDGTGKTTVAKAIGHVCEALDIPIMLTREPGGGFNNIREIIFDLAERGSKPETLAAFFAADRANHVEKIEEFLRDVPRGIVVTDRFLSSTIVFQGNAGMSVNDIYELHRITTNKYPGLTILLTFPEDNFKKVFKERMLNALLQRGSGSTHWDREKVKEHELRQKAYQALPSIDRSKGIRTHYHEIDASQSPQEVVHAVLVALERYFRSIRVDIQLIETYNELLRKPSEDFARLLLLE